MSVSYKYFPLIIEELVSNVRTEYDENNLKPTYEFGTYDEFNAEINRKNHNREIKYPCIWLIWGDGGNTQPHDITGGYTVSPRMFIINSTNPTDVSEKRYDLNFVAILYPIWELFKSELENANYFGNVEVQSYTLTEWFKQGRGQDTHKTSNKFPDFVDAIEINYNNLNVLKNCK